MSAWAFNTVRLDRGDPCGPTTTHPINPKKAEVSYWYRCAIFPTRLSETGGGNKGAKVEEILEYGDRECSKCAAIGPEQEYMPDGDYLVLQCHRCGCTWKMRPKDYEEPEKEEEDKEVGKHYHMKSEFDAPFRMRGYRGSLSITIPCQNVCLTPEGWLEMRAKCDKIMGIADKPAPEKGNDGWVKIGSGGQYISLVALYDGLKVKTEYDGAESRPIVLLRAEKEQLKALLS